MAWLLAATLMLAPDPAAAPWDRPRLPGSGMPERANRPSLPGSGMDEPDQRTPLERWQSRRRHLTRTVAVFGTMTGVGGLLMLLPFTVASDDEDGTGFFPVIATGAALFTLGGAVTTLTAPLLGHHVRWDHPRDLARAPRSYASQMSRRHVRRLSVALGIEGGAVLAGGLAVGMGFATALGCPAEDFDCQNRRTNTLATPGFTMVGLGGLAMVSTGILIGLQKRHGHVVGAGPRLAGLSPAGVTIRF